MLQEVESGLGWSAVDKWMVWGTRLLLISRIIARSGDEVCAISGIGGTRLFRRVPRELGAVALYAILSCP